MHTITTTTTIRSAAVRTAVPTCESTSVDVDPLAEVILETSSDGHSRRTPGGFVAPMWRLVVTSAFGNRIHPVLGTHRFHRGIDYGARFGTPVRSAAAGSVVWASDLGPYGTLVVIQHEPGLHTAYGHLALTHVAVGDVVRSGQRIGRVGATGLATGPHLHFEVRDDGTPTNPAQWITRGPAALGAMTDIVRSRRCSRSDRATTSLDSATLHAPR